MADLSVFEYNALVEAYYKANEEKKKALEESGQKKTIEEQILRRIKRTRKYHDMYNKDVKLTPEQLEWAKEYSKSELEEIFGAWDVELKDNKLLMTFIY